MSLVQHVSAVEGVDREPDPDTFSILSGRSRRLSLTLSYDPIPANALQASEKKLAPVGAYEFSQAKRIAHVAIGVASCFFASGTVFGFAALKFVLVDQDVYKHLCTEEELQKGVQLCYQQDIRLNLTFTVASVACNISALLVGALLDRYGPRFCSVIGSGLLLLGSLCMAFAVDLEVFDAYMVGQFFLALGGTFIFVPSFHLASAFPKLQGLILALITGAFDASASIFLFFRLLYESTTGAVGLKQFFLIYLAIPLLILILQLTLMPVQSYETRTQLDLEEEQAKDPGQDIHDSDSEVEDEAELWRVRSTRQEDRKRILAEIGELLGPQTEREEYFKKENDIQATSGVWGALHGLPASTQIQSPWFLLLTLFTVIQMTRFNYFIATIWSQYRYMLNSATKAGEVNDFFDVALPVGGIVTVPFIGILLDKTSTATVLGLLVLLGITTGVLGIIPSLWSAYGNVLVFVIFRPLYYSTMSDYAVKVFGFATFGTVYGTIICISGVFTLFAQTNLQAISHDAFHDSPVPVNIILTGLGLLSGATLVAFVAIRGRVVRKEHAEDDERRSLLPRPSIGNLYTVREAAEAETQG